MGTLRQTEYTIEKPLPAVNAAGRGFLYEKFQISTSNRPIISGMVKIDKSVLRTYSALECAASRIVQLSHGSDSCTGGCDGREINCHQNCLAIGNPTCCMYHPE